MPLTDVERRNLAEISSSLRQSDPRLTRRLSRGSFRPRTVDVVTAVIAVALLASLAVGIACQLPIVCAVAWTAAIGLAMVRGFYANDEY
ncbi:DUF3040 domain-containing protein [uncultured Jatrophihabitans sp.]|uniref:DUF3040 domain-containing protein n=1 Tax=uncultured Jatrophihabitans sp. TaxID=1610747 RepID=UPI0035CA2EFD